MAENRPHRPFAADIQVMQRTFFVQAGVCGIRVLQNFVAENNFLVPSDNLGQPSSSQYQNFSRAETVGSRTLSNRQTLPNQFDGLDFPVHRRRRCNQYDLITLEFDAADQVLTYIVLNR